MGIITHWLNQTFRKISYTHNRYGDLIKTGTAYYPCRFRYMTFVDKNTNREALNSNGQIWFEADASIQEGDIGEVDGHMWQIDRLIKARKLGSTVHFLKAEVSVHSLSLVS